MSILSKEQSQRRWSECQTLLSEWDPIGVMDDPNWPRDEYHCMVGPILRLLESDATEAEIAAYLRAELSEHFGMQAEVGDVTPVARRARSWFSEHWAQN